VCFFNHSALETDEVDVSLYDHDMVGSHDFLGRIGIPVCSIEEGGGARTHAHWVKLRSARPPPAPYLGTCYLSGAFILTPVRAT
jgi:hypothetical protein